MVRIMEYLRYCLWHNSNSTYLSVASFVSYEGFRVIISSEKEAWEPKTVYLTVDTFLTHKFTIYTWFAVRNHYFITQFIVYLLTTRTSLHSLINSLMASKVSLKELYFSVCFITHRATFETFILMPHHFSHNKEFSWAPCPRTMYWLLPYPMKQANMAS